MNEKITIQKHDAGKIVEATISGKLSKKDYLAILPAFEQSIQDHGKIRILVVMKDFEGWTAGAMWEDLKFDFKHFKDFEKVAVVGESKWHKTMTQLFKPFTKAETKYFDADHGDEAARWVAA